jgi:hypothetical protein
MLTDAISAVDAVLAYRTVSRLASEGLNLTDERIISRRLMSVVAEVISLADSIIRSVAWSGQIWMRVSQDGVEIGDPTLRYVTRLSLAQEAAQLGDAAYYGVQRVRSLVDQVMVDSTLNKNTTLRGALGTEAIDVTDGGYTITMRFNRDMLADALDVSDEQLSAYISYASHFITVRAVIGSEVPNVIGYQNDNLIGSEFDIGLGVDMANVIGWREENLIGGTVPYASRSH